MNSSLVIIANAKRFSLASFMIVAFAKLVFFNSALAIDGIPASLKGITVPVTPGLFDGSAPIVVDKKAALQLGKALFWDINVGSDGMACGSCHFHAGADGRVKNQFSPGLAHTNAKTSTTFETTASGAVSGVNYTPKLSDFPFHQLTDPTNKDSAVVFTTDDVFSSAGVFLRDYKKYNSADITHDECITKTDFIFHNADLNTRQSQSRHTPSVINSGFNYRNFWDGRANNIFNGVTPYGVRDRNAGIWVLQNDGTVRKQTLRLENASLASQAVTPAINTSEMSCGQRKLPQIAHKLLKQRPLVNQEVHPQDSVLGERRYGTGKGLNTTYERLIKKAFASRYWGGKQAIKFDNTLTTSQIEANFSLFFGLALQTYEQTLISDQTPFDTPLKLGDPAIPEGLNPQQARGLTLFLDNLCAACHKGPTLSAAVNPNLYNVPSPDKGLVIRKTLNGAFTNDGVVFGTMDEGYFNTSVTPTSHDLGVGGTDPYGNPLSFSVQYFQTLLNNKEMIDPLLVKTCLLSNPFAKDYAPNELIKDVKSGTAECGARAPYALIPNVAVLQKEIKKEQQGRALIAVKGAFKVPSLRNIELTAPYMHNGSMLTLEQVVDFYFRGGNFKNPHHFATVVFPRSILPSEKADLVAFLKSLTDERVRWEKAPFDHPQLLVPNGHQDTADPENLTLAADNFINVPAVGKYGRNRLLGPLKSMASTLKP